MDLSIIIITHKRPVLLQACLNSLRQTNVRILKKFELIVVLNGEDNESLSLLNDHSLSPQIITLPSPLTPAAARNLAAKQARAPWLLFLDDDTEVPFNYIGLGLNYLELHPDIDVLGGPEAIHPLANIWEKNWSLALSSPLLTAHTTLRHQSTHLDPFETDERAFILCALWFRRSLFSEEGFAFDPHFFRNEENVLLFHLKENGKKLVYHPVLSVIHRKRTNLYYALRGVFFSGHYRAQSIVEQRSHLPWLFLTPSLALLLAFIFLISAQMILKFLILCYLILILFFALQVASYNIFNGLMISLLHPPIHLAYGLGQWYFFLKKLLRIKKDAEPISEASNSSVLKYFFE